MKSSCCSLAYQHAASERTARTCPIGGKFWLSTVHLKQINQSNY